MIDIAELNGTMADGTVDQLPPMAERAIRLATWAQRLSAHVLARYPNDAIAHAVACAADAPSSYGGRHIGVSAQASADAACAHRSAERLAVILEVRNEAWADV